MSRFYANIQGNRGEATRQGTEKSGMYGHIRGWNLGAKVIMDTDSQDRDVVTITITGGSTGMWPGELVGSFVRGEDGTLEQLSSYALIPKGKLSYEED